MVSPHAAVVRPHQRIADCATEIRPALPVNAIPIVGVISSKDHSVPIMPRTALIRRLQYLERHTADKRPSVLLCADTPKTVFLVLTCSDEPYRTVFIDILPICIYMPAFAFDGEA